MSSVYDLHSHSTESDGTLSPQDLVAHAASQGVSVLALTDHDSTAGIERARKAAAEHGVTLIPGVEISVSWQRQTVHIVGLNIDINNKELQDGLGKLREYRDIRACTISERLEKSGIEGALAGAKRYTTGRLIGRVHFARYLVEIGRAKSVREVFKKFLVRNKPGYVAGQWATLEQAVSWIIRSGGIAVIAHPARYKMTATRLNRLIQDFKQMGGQGLEVLSGSHSVNEIQHMTAVALRHELLASAGSDYHGPDNPWIEMGRLRDMPVQLMPVWRSSLWPQTAA